MRHLRLETLLRAVVIAGGKTPQSRAVRAWQNNYRWGPAVSHGNRIQDDIHQGMRPRDGEVRREGLAEASE